MPIPTPPADNAGGIMVVKYASSTNSHLLRVHLASPMSNDSVATYTVPVTGRETTAAATFAAFALVIKPYINNGFTLSLFALYNVVAHLPVQFFTWSPPATVAGSNVTAASDKALYWAFNFRTVNGGRARFFIFQSPGLAPPSASNITSSSGGQDGALMAYLTGAATMVVGHDGSGLVNNAREVQGYNKRLRRKEGSA